MNTRPRLTRSIPFWLLVAGSLASGAAGGVVLMDKLAKMETALTAAARARSCRVLDGGAMLVAQAAYALTLLTGAHPDLDRMRRHLAELTTSGGTVEMPC